MKKKADSKKNVRCFVCFVSFCSGKVPSNSSSGIRNPIG